SRWLKRLFHCDFINSAHASISSKPAGLMEYIRFCATFFTQTKLFCFSTFRCWDTAGWLRELANFSQSSETLNWPVVAKDSNICRLLGSEMAVKVSTGLYMHLCLYK